MSYFPVNPKNKRPLVKDWQNHVGEKKGSYGISLTAENLVIDFDPRNYKEGENPEEYLLLMGYLPDTKVVTTRQGKHYYYKKPKEIGIQKNIKDLTGVDFLSKGRYVVGEGSIIQGVKYVSNDQPVVKVSSDILELIRRTPPETSALPLEQPSIEFSELQRLIHYLPAQYWVNHDKWVGVGMCIHHAENGSKRGLNLWDKWSQQSKKNYEIGECSKRWASFKSDCDPNRVTIGTLFSWAVKEGYTMKRPQGDELPPLEKPSGQKDTASLLLELSSWVFINNKKRFYNLQDGRVYDVDTMRLYYKRVLPKGDPIGIILQSKDLTYADDFTYYPGETHFVEQNNQLLVNRWKKSNVEAKMGDPSPFVNHAKWLLEDDWEILIEWLSWCVQYPNDRMKWAVILTGGSRTGKSYFGEMLSHILGDHNVSRPSSDGLHEKYTHWIINTQLVIVNELMSSGRRDLMNRLKEVITERKVPVREMHVGEYDFEAKCNLLFFSNYDLPILLDHDDRRFCLLKTFRCKRPKEYYDKLWQWSLDNLGVIKNYLANVNLSQFDKESAPITFSKLRLLSETDAEGYDLVIDEWVEKSERTLFTLSEAQKAVSDGTGDYLENKRIANILRRKYQFLDRVNKSSGRERIYTKLANVNRYRKFNANQLLTLLNQEQKKND